MNKIDALIEDAKADGMEVRRDSGTTLIVAKRDRRSGRVSRGLVIYSDGTAFDATVRPDVAKGIRSAATMRKILGLH